jgi:hypothetical protein
MRVASLALVMASVLFLAPASLLGQHRTRACDVGPPGLPEQDAAVIFRNLPFTHAQIQHRLKTFSESAQSGQTMSEYCFRYEVENAGDRPIRNLQWALASIWADPLNPGLPNRRYNVKRRQIVDPPIDIDSRINTFENTPVMTRAYADRRDPQSATLKVNPSQQTVLTAGDVIPQLTPWLKQSNLPVVPIIALRLSNDPGTLTYRLSDDYNGPGFQLSTTSTARRQGQDVLIDTTVSAKGAASQSAQLAMPALYALQQPKDTRDINEYSSFLSRFLENSKRFEPNKNVWNFTLRVPLTMLTNGSVYQMRHPIVLQSGESFDCVLVESYSPLALNFALPQCPRAGTR